MDKSQETAAPTGTPAALNSNPTSARLPTGLVASILGTFLICFTATQYKDRSENLLRYVQVQTNSAAALRLPSADRDSLPYADILTTLSNIPSVAEITVSSADGIPVAHLRAANRTGTRWLPTRWQFAEIHSSPEVNPNEQVHVVVSLHRLHVSLLSALLGLSGFAGILIFGALRYSRSSDDKVQAIHGAMQHQTLTDRLTGLSNREGLEAELGGAKARMSAARGPFALLFVNIDNFKALNDSWGYRGGDQILVQVAQRLSSTLGSRGHLARTEADEFAIVYEDVADESALSRWVDTLIASISSAPLLVDGSSVHVSVSVGVAYAPSAAIDVDALKMHAEAALATAKKNGKNTQHVFSNALAQSLHERAALHAMMQLAIRNREFFMVYQPIVDLHTLRVTSLEALIRWRHPERGLIMPGTFMPIAEETGMIVEIGEIVLQETCNDLKWLATQMDVGALSAAVNLSIHQFKRPNTADRLAGIVRAAGFVQDQIQFEVTESTMMESAQSSAEGLSQLQRLGFSLSIDDFGTGYSSLGRLKEVNTKKLKVDRSLVTKIDSDEANQAIFTAVVQMAHSLGMRVVAEGVETLEEARAVRRMGCDELQGYLVARPQPIRQLRALLDGMSVNDDFQLQPQPPLTTG